MGYYDNWKTDTVERKLRGAKGKARRRLVFELHSREPERARRVLAELLEGTRHAGARRALRSCQLIVADAELARELLPEPFFDPSDLPLSAFCALLDDTLRALAEWDEPRLVEHLQCLGFLAGEVPNPRRDQPIGSEAFKSSPERYFQALAAFLRGLLDAPQLAPHRARITRQLANLYHPAGFAALLDAWRAGVAVPDSEVGLAVQRLGWEPSTRVVGEAALREWAVGLVNRRDLMLATLAPSLPGELGLRALAVALVHPGLGATRKSVARALVTRGPAGLDVLRGAPLDRWDLAAILSAIPYDMARSLAAKVGAPGLARSHPDRPNAEIVAERTLEKERRVPALLSQARDGTQREREQALYELGKLGATDAIPLLMKALDDPEMANARTLVRTALQRCGAPGDWS